MEKKARFNTGLRSADGKGKRRNKSVAAVLPVCTEWGKTEGLWRLNRRWRGWGESGSSWRPCRWSQVQILSVCEVLRRIWRVRVCKEGALHVEGRLLRTNTAWFFSVCVRKVSCVWSCPKIQSHSFRSWRRFIMVHYIRARDGCKSPLPEHTTTSRQPGRREADKTLNIFLWISTWWSSRSPRGADCLCACASFQTGPSTSDNPVVKVEWEGGQSTNTARSQINRDLIGRILPVSFFWDKSDWCRSYQWGKIRLDCGVTTV